MASSSSDQPASSTGGVVAQGVGAHKVPAEELGEQIVNLKKQQHELLREKKKLQASLRNAQRRKKRLCQRTRMLSDTDLLAIVRMREAHCSKENKDGSQKSGKGAEPETPGAAAVSDVTAPAAEKQAAAASEGNADQLDKLDSEGSPAA